MWLWYDGRRQRHGHRRLRRARHEPRRLTGLLGAYLALVQVRCWRESPGSTGWPASTTSRSSIAGTATRPWRSSSPTRCSASGLRAARRRGPVGRGGDAARRRHLPGHDHGDRRHGAHRGRRPDVDRRPAAASVRVVVRDSPRGLRRHRARLVPPDPDGNELALDETARTTGARSTS